MAFLHYYRLNKIFPRAIMIEPSNICNSNCIFCPSSDLTRPRGFMSFELCKKILDEAVTYPEFKNAIFYGLAEPLTDRGIFDKIQYAKEKGVTVYTSTNAALLNEERARKVLDSGLDRLKISLDGNTKETYESIRRNLNFEKTCRNVIRFFEMKKELGKEKPFVVLRTACTETTKPEIESYIRKWRELADAICIASVANWAGYNKYDNRRKVTAQIQPCCCLWQSPLVTWDGRVPLCFFDVNNQFDLGDVNQDSLYDIWNSERLQLIRKNHLELKASELPFCAGCEAFYISKKKPVSFINKSNGKNVLLEGGHDPSDFQDIAECLTTKFDYMQLHQADFSLEA